MTDEQQGAQEHIPVQPMPTSYGTGTAQVAPGVTLVVLQVHTPAGTGTYFMDPQAAEALATALVRSSKLAATGLHVVNHALPPESPTGA